MRLLLVAAALLVHCGAVRRRHFAQYPTHNLTADGIQLEKYVTVDSATGIHYNPISKQHPGRRVCAKEVLYPIKSKQAYCKPIFKKYQERCNNNQICTGVRLTYETAYRDVLTKHSKRLSYACCPGWTQVNTKTYGCNKPICSAPCQNGGTCTKPDICVCTEGFTGRFCELDVDECKEYKPCDQICENTRGSFKCDCRESFTLQSDGQSCRTNDAENTAFEANDLEFSSLNKRITNLENVKKEIQNIKNEIDIVNKDISSIKLKIQDTENYKNDIQNFKNTLKQVEKSTNRLEEFMRKCDKYKMKFY
ncbi:Calcium-binding EGF domain [Popillia japonica]|uniref:Calcium-binding EGF domain n=1 Tax=Popillia japonica TaxID=7064 RepID=A0AAW1HXD8_POPJA